MIFIKLIFKSVNPNKKVQIPFTKNPNIAIHICNLTFEIKYPNTDIKGRVVS